MIVTQLAHMAIKSPNLGATERFYTELLGMELAARPEMDFPGLWIKAASPGGDAILHFYGGHAAKSPDGSVPSGTGAIDHVAIAAQGFAEMRNRLLQSGLSWRENLVVGTPLWQIFVYDPSGVLLELTFDGDAEGVPTPTIPEALQYRPATSWFRPDEYLRFAT